MFKTLDCISILFYDRYAKIQKNLGTTLNEDEIEQLIHSYYKEISEKCDVPETWAYICKEYLKKSFLLRSRTVATLELE
jgi:hypothetical protein